MIQETRLVLALDQILALKGVQLIHGFALTTELQLHRTKNNLYSEGLMFRQKRSTGGKLLKAVIYDL